MSHFYAEFGMHGSPPVQIRKDTRVYFHSATGRRPTNGRCRGVVWMCNPGSATTATASGWGPITPDPTLHVVLRLIVTAATVAPPLALEHDYVSILNCFYTCDPLASVAFNQWVKSRCDYSESIPVGAQFVLLAWGSDKPNGLVAKALNDVVCSRRPFFFHDPMTDPSTPVSVDFNSMWFPAHPLNPSFQANLPAIAAMIARHL
jgi:hypothetical protein